MSGVGNVESGCLESQVVEGVTCNTDAIGVLQGVPSPTLVCEQSPDLCNTMSTEVSVKIVSLC